MGTRGLAWQGAGWPKRVPAAEPAADGTGPRRAKGRGTMGAGALACHKLPSDWPPARLSCSRGAPTGRPPLMLSPVHPPACPQLMSAATGMLYLHNRPAGAIVHRDLKSPNLLVDQGWNCKVGGGTASCVDLKGGKCYKVSEVASTCGAWPMHGQGAGCMGGRWVPVCNSPPVSLNDSKTDHKARSCLRLLCRSR